jgi:hypothetical protein
VITTFTIGDTVRYLNCHEGTSATNQLHKKPIHGVVVGFREKSIVVRFANGGRTIEKRIPPERLEKI